MTRVTFFFQPCGSVEFWLIFLFGHYVWGYSRPSKAFVDKACIPQSDEEQKRRGILALAGFLRSSDRLVTLWTPRYFTRLWCVFEVAVWFNIGRELKFVPVSSALLLIKMQIV